MEKKALRNGVSVYRGELKTTNDLEPVTEHIALRTSTKLALDIIGRKPENYDDVLRRLLCDREDFVGALEKAYKMISRGITDVNDEVAVCHGGATK